QEILKCYVAHTEAHCRHRLHAKQPNQAVVATTAEHTAVVLWVGIYHLEHEVGVVVKATHKGDVELSVGNPTVFQHIHQLVQTQHRLPGFEPGRQVFQPTCFQQLQQAIEHAIFALCRS